MDEVRGDHLHKSKARFTAKPKPPAWRRPLLLASGAFVGVLAIVGALGAGDIIDLPGWANVPGVDVPLIGDKDAIDCRLSIADDTSTPVVVRINIVDGNTETHVDYQYVWNNGNLVDNTMFERLAADELLVPVQDDTNAEQFFSVSIVPEREGRVFCESIFLR